MYVFSIYIWNLIIFPLYNTLFFDPMNMRQTHIKVPLFLKNIISHKSYNKICINFS